MDFTLLRDLHAPNPRQGPGSLQHTQRALALTGLDSAQPLVVADIGCGTGASTCVLARELNAHIYAIDIFPEFLANLRADAAAQGVEGGITPIACSMDALPFHEKRFDLIWSEGAIYSMGFANGVAYIKQFLRPGGITALSEIIWLTPERPAEIQAFWDTNYSEIGTAADKIAVLEKEGFTSIEYFALPKECWTENYYKPLRARLPKFLAEQNNSEAAQQIVEAEEAEIALYEKFSDYYSYGFFVAKYNG